MGKKTTKTYRDPAGTEIPAKYVPAYDKTRDRIANKIYDLWTDEEQRLHALKATTNRLIDELRQAAADDAAVKLGGEKGYLQFRSFDGKITIRFENARRTEFDERLTLAQQLIKEVLCELAEGAKSADLVEIVSHAFAPRKGGNLDMQRIRDLCRLNVSHPKWKKAVEIIRECERTIGHKQYVRVSKRLAADAEPVNVVLDIAAL